MREVTIGFIGGGFVGQLAHLHHYVTIPGCRVVALAELRPGLGRRVADRYGIPRLYPSHQELLRDPEVEAVVAVTPRRWTGPVALDCLKAGKHLLTEKPMAATVEQAEVLVEAARRRRLHYAVGYMKRHDEGVERAKEILDKVMRSGELGPVTFARAHCFGGDGYCNVDGAISTDEQIPDGEPAWPIAPRWLPEDRHREFASFLNEFCHNINLLRYLLGRTPSVNYVGFDRPAGKIAVLDFGDHRAVLEAGRLVSRTWDEVTEIYFSHGRLRVETPPPLLRNVPARVELYRGGDMSENYVPQLGWTWAFRRQSEAFVNAIRDGREPLSSGADALEDMRLIEEMWRMEVEGAQHA